MLILIVGSWLFNGPIKEWQAEWSKPKNFFAELDFALINQIEITEGEESMKLVLTDNRWLIDGTKDFFVVEETMEMIKTSLEKARDAELELVGENPDKKGDFSTGETGVQIKLRQGETVLFDFVQGSASDDFTGSYFSEAEQDKTFFVPANLNNAFVRDDWFDKTIFAFAEEKVNRVRFQYPKTEFMVEKKEDNVKSTEDETLYFWEGTEPYQFRVDDEKIKNIINSLSSLEASSIPAQTFEGTGLEKNLIIVEVSLDDESSHTIMVGISPNEEADTVEFFAKRGDSDNIYMIRKDIRDSLDTTIRGLR